MRLNFSDVRRGSCRPIAVRDRVFRVSIGDRRQPVERSSSVAGNYTRVAGCGYGLRQLRPPRRARAKLLAIWPTLYQDRRFGDVPDAEKQDPDRSTRPSRKQSCRDHRLRASTCDARQFNNLDSRAGDRSVRRVTSTRGTIRTDETELSPDRGHDHRPAPVARRERRGRALARSKRWRGKIERESRRSSAGCSAS